MLYCNYSIVVTMYLSDDLTIYQSMFMFYKYDEIGVQGVNILCLFAYMMLLAAPQVKNQHRCHNILENNKHNIWIVLALLILLSITYVFGINTPLQGATRGGPPSAIYEYSVIFVLLGLCYSGKNRILKAIFIVVGLMFAVKGFISGERVGGVQLIMMLVLAFRVEKMKFWRIAPVGLFLFIIMIGIGHSRASFSFSSKTLEYTVNSLFRGKLAMDTAYAAYHAGLTYLDALRFTDLGTKIYLFWRFILAQLIGSSRVPDYSLARYANSLSLRNLGGGVLPYHCYFYFGIAGVIIFGLYLKYIFKIVRDVGKSNNGFLKCVAMYSVCAVPRWYLYAPINIIRSLMLIAIAYYVLDYVDRATKLCAKKL